MRLNFRDQVVPSLEASDDGEGTGVGVSLPMGGSPRVQYTRMEGTRRLTTIVRLAQAVRTFEPTVAAYDAGRDGLGAN